MPNSSIRALLVWLLIALAEIVHGAIRRVLLVPVVGDFRAGQIGAAVGSVIILGIAFLCVRWIGANTRGALIRIGLLWLCLMLAFEVFGGRVLAGFSWTRILSDYDLRQGGLLGFGMLVLALSPLLAARLRGLPINSRQKRLPAPIVRKRRRRIAP
jgi:hypothetical protein